MYNPDQPYLATFHLRPFVKVTRDDIWYLWCLMTLYRIALNCPLMQMHTHLSNPGNEGSVLWQLLEMINPLMWWRQEVERDQGNASQYIAEAKH
ncbi:hypothetical protein L484_023649 [Morus notabilis]|uniref:Uncharacterized protein n=1 Tax=Morus notabilis TaxID=981085 RepID=W9S5N6_9ROSA|nr:hypothetical protein L484_023649 [Morus notabilis]